MNNTQNRLPTVELPLIKPVDILRDLPLPVSLSQEIAQSRNTVKNILQGKDHRLMVIAGPCSLHDPKEALDYAHLLKEASLKYNNELFIIMRAYFAKPRTQKGWKGYIYDPFLDGSQNLEKGLTLTRELLIQLAQLLPLGSEFLDSITACYLKDLISWGAIGARTSASQPHRELASGLPMPVGFKNSVDGNVQIAVHAAESATLPHCYFGMSMEGTPAIIQTRGNPNTHIILRGSLNTPNYSAHHLNEAATLLKAAGLEPRIIIDCSHDNCSKQFERQAEVVHDLMKYLKDSPSPVAVCGLMLESYLESGKQPMPGAYSLTYGQSITDPCLSWLETEKLLGRLAKTIAERISHEQTS